ncbi:MAG: glycosyltransferase [Chloroflexota bacterium]
MQIVFVGPFGLQPKGTMSGRALPLARALVARGHAVTILIPPWDDPGRAGQAWLDAGVQVVNVLLPPGLPLLFHLWLTVTLVRQALAWQPAAVHLFKPKAYAGLTHLALAWLRRRWRLPLRLVVDADDWEQAWNEALPYPAWQKKFFAWQERWGLRHADAITVASRALAELAESLAGVAPERIIYVPNGHPGMTAAGRPPSAEFERRRRGAEAQRRMEKTPPPDEENILTILLYSRLAEFPLEQMVGLVRRVAAQAPAARWLMVGRGFLGEEKILADKLQQAGLGEYVEFAGWPVADVSACFQAATVAVYPYAATLLNRTKCSVKLIELMAAGLPVVASAVGQNCEYIRHEVSGLLIPPADDDAFAAAVVSLLNDPRRRQQLGQAARQTILEHYTWDRLAQVVEKAYAPAA